MARKVGKHQKEKTKKFRFPFFRILSLIIVVVCVIYIWQWTKENKHSDDVMKIVNEAIVQEKGEDEKEGENNSSINFDKLKEINPDVIGWIKVNNTEINYPVVQSEDNSFYLDHSFDKAYNAAGWPFMDYRVDLDGKDKNMTIYGHNRKDRSMFGSLEDVLESKWYENKNNLKIEYTTENGKEIYQVFSIYQIEKETYYTNNYFASDEEFTTFINELKNRSKVDFGVEVNSDDTILTLSTCADNNQYRTVLHAKKVS